jgi:hypothetical protein
MPEGKFNNNIMVSIRQYFEALLQQYKEAHDKEHTLLEKSTELAKQNLEIRLEGMNEFRKQIQEERGSFVNRDKFDILMGALDRRISAIESFQSKIIGVGLAATFLLTVLELILRFLVR